MNIQELKQKMSRVPDHKMNHDRPMVGPVRNHRLEALRAKKRADMQKPISKGYEAPKFAHASPKTAALRAAASQPSEREKMEHQKRTGRAYSD